MTEGVCRPIQTQLLQNWLESPFDEVVWFGPHSTAEPLAGFGQPARSEEQRFARSTVHNEGM
jgi:hypothetical protein